MSIRVRTRAEGAVDDAPEFPAAERRAQVARRRAVRSSRVRPAGGIRTLADARDYMALTARWLGEAAVSPRRFRIGASALLDDLEAVLLTFGRGLNIVARASDAWGAEIEDDGSATQPAPPVVIDGV